MDNRPAPLGFPSAFDNLFPRNLPPAPAAYLAQPPIHCAELCKSDWIHSELGTVPMNGRHAPGMDYSNPTRATNHALAALFGTPFPEAVPTQVTNEFYSAPNHVQQSHLLAKLPDTDSSHTADSTLLSGHPDHSVQLAQASRSPLTETDYRNTSTMATQPYETDSFQSFFTSCPQMGFFNPSGRYARYPGPTGLRHMVQSTNNHPFLDLRTDPKLSDRQFGGGQVLESTPITPNHSVSSNTTAAATVAAIAAAANYMVTGTTNTPEFGSGGGANNSMGVPNTESDCSSLLLPSDRSPSSPPMEACSTGNAADSSIVTLTNSKTSSLSPTQIWPWMTVVAPAAYLAQPPIHCAELCKSDWIHSELGTVPMNGRHAPGMDYSNPTRATNHALAALFGTPFPEAVPTQVTNEFYSAPNHVQVSFGQPTISSDSHEKMNNYFSSSTGLMTPDRCFIGLPGRLQQSHLLAKLPDTDSSHTADSTLLSGHPDHSVQLAQASRSPLTETDYRNTSTMATQPYETDSFQSFFTSCPQMGFFNPSGRYARYPGPTGLRHMVQSTNNHPFLDLRTDPKLSDRQFGGGQVLESTPITPNHSVSSNTTAAATVAAIAAAANYMVTGTTNTPEFGSGGGANNSMGVPNTESDCSSLLLPSDRSPSSPPMEACSTGNAADSSIVTLTNSKTSSLSPTQIWPWMTVVGEYCKLTNYKLSTQWMGRFHIESIS
ncbi:hypothetical protein AHF37_04908 [Paragonimus kellicotti]|nr:hypothetical protein AHF37_04908 [Paragonimus kellicotti]